MKLSKLKQTKMRSDKHIKHSRESTTLLPWFSLASVAFLPFAFGKGFAPILYLLSALLVGFIWLLLILRQWKTGGVIWCGLGALLLIVGHRVTDNLLVDQGGAGYLLQWGFIVLAVVGGSVFLFKSRILTYCEL